MKKRGLIIIIFSAFGSFPLVFSQDFPDSSYYPLGMGYQWNYSNVYFPHPETIVDTTRINGLLYYGLAVWAEEAEHWLREDSCSVYLLNTKDGSDFLLFDFDADTGESWELPSGYECSFGTRITLASKKDTIVTPADTFSNCYHFEHEPLCFDAGIYDTWFARGTGKVRYLEDNIAGRMDYNLTTYTIVTLANYEGLSLIDYSYQLGQNYPNPFNTATTIEFSMPRSGSVTLIVCDILGRKVTTLVHSWQDAGRHSVQWDASNVSSGIYFVRMKTDRPSASTTYGSSRVRKVALLR